MERAPAPTRSSATITVSFGLLSIPCAIYSGTEDTAVKRREFVRTFATDEDGEPLVNEDGEPVINLVPAGRAPINKETGELVSNDDIVRLVETDHGPVEVTSEEWSALTGAAPGTAEVVCFLPLAHMAAGHYVPEQMYQIKPKKEGKGKNKVEVSGKPFDLLMAAMRRQAVFAIVRVTTRSGTSPRFGALMPNERLYLLHFDNEVRATIERDPNDISEVQLERAAKMIAEATTKEPPELVDDASARIREFAEQRARDGEVPEVKELVAEVETVNDLDSILEAMGV